MHILIGLLTLMVTGGVLQVLSEFIKISLK